MKYFLDTEFIEGTQENWFARTKPTIDLISIGIKCEDGREYYSISKDFNLSEAWNRYDMKAESCPITGVKSGRMVKEYWLRVNVLKPIFRNFISGDMLNMFDFSYSTMKFLINKFGKSNKEIAEEIKKFCSDEPIITREIGILETSIGKPTCKQQIGGITVKDNKPEFYAYYGDYDWVAFCWLFGKMIDLPKEFPKYCKDLQQIFDEKKSLVKGRMKDQPGFPINKGIHNALEDAKWNFELFKFLNTI